MFSVNIRYVQVDQRHQQTSTAIPYVPLISQPYAATFLFPTISPDITNWLEKMRDREKK
jgi:hypothetical protein